MKSKFVAGCAIAVICGALAGCGSNVDQGEPPTEEAKTAFNDLTRKSLESPLAKMRLSAVKSVGEMDPAVASEAITIVAPRSGTGRPYHCSCSV